MSCRLVSSRQPQLHLSKYLINDSADWILTLRSPSPSSKYPNYPPPNSAILTSHPKRSSDTESRYTDRTMEAEWPEFSKFIIDGRLQKLRVPEPAVFTSILVGCCTSWCLDFRMIQGLTCILQVDDQCSTIGR